MKNTELLKRAQASLDILRGYAKALDPETLTDADTSCLTDLIQLAATVPIRDTLQRKGRQALTED